MKWQLASRLHKVPVVHNFTPKSKLWVWRGLTGATGNIYCGLHEFEDMAFLLHFLRESDLFVDVGANIGSYTILASAQVGTQTIAIEPIPQTYKNLLQNIELNNITEKVAALNIGAGSSKSTLRFTASFDTGNHVVAEDSTESVSVEVDSLDTILDDKHPSLLKIDVEGFETEVLNGAADVLKSSALKAIIIELNGSGNRYGFDEDAIHAKLTNSGFKTFAYLPFERGLIASPRKSMHNTLYIRDYDFVTQRLLDGDAITIKGVTF